MTRAEAYTEGKKHIKDYLEPQKKGRDKYNCPLCGSGTGAKKTPAGSIKNDKFSCFSCNSTSLDIFDLIEKSENLDKEKAFERVCSLYGIRIDDSPYTGINQTTGEQREPLESSRTSANEKIGEYTEKGIKELQTCHRALEYLKERGFTEETIKQFKIGYDSLNKAIIIPYGNDVPYYVTRTIEGKFFKYPKTDEAGAKQVFNLSALYNEQGAPVFIVESQICAISIEQEGGKAIALGGTGTTPLINALKELKSENPLIISFDNDDPGKEMRDKLITELKEIGIKAYTYSFDISESKDPNEALMKNKLAFQKAIEEESQIIRGQHEADKNEAKTEYINTTSAKAYFQKFLDGIKNSEANPYIPTGFNELDRVLDGGLYGGLYIIGAISSLGKTTFALQLVDQIAKSGRDVLIFSLEMARNELIAKSISRITKETEWKSEYNDKARTVREITNGVLRKQLSPAQRTHIEQSEQEYASKYLDNLWIYEGVGDIGVNQIREIVQKHISITGNKPVVLIDYLQLLAPYDMRSSDKQNTDKAVLELKRISRDSNIPIIAISSFNRSNYDNEVSMSAFKESGAIEYSSDVLIGLQLKGVGNKDFDIDEAKQKDPRRVELKILKNRNGITGATLGYDYHTKYNCFAEC